MELGVAGWELGVKVRVRVRVTQVRDLWLV
jgi:hypothetical protein